MISPPDNAGSPPATGPLRLRGPASEPVALAAYRSAPPLPIPAVKADAAAVPERIGDAEIEPERIEFFAGLEAEARLRSQQLPDGARVELTHDAALDLRRKRQERWSLIGDLILINLFAAAFRIALHHSVSPVSFVAVMLISVPFQCVFNAFKRKRPGQPARCLCQAAGYWLVPRDMPGPKARLSPAGYKPQVAYRELQTNDTAGTAPAGGA